MLLRLWVPLCSFIILSLELQKETLGWLSAGPPEAHVTPSRLCVAPPAPRLSMPGLGARGGLYADCDLLGLGSQGN